MLIFVSDSCNSTEEIAAKADVVLALAGKPLVGRVERTQNGAPKCKNYKISATHTDGVILLALADVPVGIDVEREDRKPPVSMRSIYNWTAYEAKRKMTGEGIKLAEIREGGDYTDGVSFHSFLDGKIVAIAGGGDDVFTVWVYQT